jgi:hypothetical protein
MPLITVLYGAESDVGLLALPLLIYHASQIAIGSFLVSRMKIWVLEKNASSKAASNRQSEDSGEEGTSNLQGDGEVSKVVILTVQPAKGASLP